MAFPQDSRTVSTPEPLQVTSALTGPAALENATVPVVKGGARRPLAVVLVSVVDPAGPAVSAGLVVGGRRDGTGLVVAGSVAAGSVVAAEVDVAVADVVVVLALVVPVVRVVVVVVEPNDLVLSVTCVAGVVLVG